MSNYHVYPKRNKWVVRIGKSTKAVRVDLNKNKAVQLAINLAFKNNVDVVVHDKDLSVSIIYRFRK